MPIPEDIAKLEKAFKDARTQDFAPEIYDRFIDEDPDKMNINDRFKAINIAYIENIRDTMEARIDLMRYTLQFWQRIINEVDHLAENVAFFSSEISGDVDVHKGLDYFMNSEISTLFKSGPESGLISMDRQISDMSLGQEFNELHAAVCQSIENDGKLDQIPQSALNADPDIEQCDTLSEKLLALRCKMADQIRYISDLHVKRADILLEHCFFTSAREDITLSEGQDRDKIIDDFIKNGEGSLSFSRIATTSAIPHYEEFPNRFSDANLTL